MADFSAFSGSVMEGASADASLRSPGSPTTCHSAGLYDLLSDRKMLCMLREGSLHRPKGAPLSM